MGVNPNASAMPELSARNPPPGLSYPHSSDRLLSDDNNSPHLCVIVEESESKSVQHSEWTHVSAIYPCVDQLKYVDMFRTI